MNLRTLLGSTALAAAALAPATLVHARQALPQAVIMAAPSQERTLGTDTRAAGEFRIAGIPGGQSRITTVRAVMIGKGFAGIPQSPLKFGITIYASAPLSISMPGVPVYSLPSAASVVDLGSVGGGYRRYQVTFNFPSMAAKLPNNRRFWLSTYGQHEDANNWRFAREGTAAATVPTWIRIGNMWSSLALAAGDRAFTVQSVPVEGGPGPLVVRRLGRHK